MGICLVMKNNFRRSLRHKIRWLIIFLIPVVLSPLTILINQIQENTYRVGVINSMASNNETIDNLESRWMVLKEDGRIHVETANQDSYHTDLILGTYEYVIDCSKGFCEDAVISTKKDKDNQEFFQKVINGSSQEDVIPIEPEEKRNLLRMKQSVGFLMSLFMIMAVVQGGMYLRDKNQGLILRYCYAPKKKKNYLAGNLCFIFLITLLQVAVSFLLLCAVNGVWLSLITSIRIIAVITAAASVFAVILCSICRNDTQAGISASAITAFLTVIGGVFVSIESMPQVLQVISKVNPIRWCMEIVKL